MHLRGSRLAKLASTSALVVGLIHVLSAGVARADEQEPGAPDPGGDPAEGGTSVFTVNCATMLVTAVVDQCDAGFVPTQQVGTAYTGTACDGADTGSVQVTTGCNHR
jgi:hypothetical protein